MKTYSAKLAALGMIEDLETSLWSKSVERDGLTLRLVAVDWIAARRLVLRVHIRGRSEALCRWTIGSSEPEGAALWATRCDLADLRAIHAALGLLLETVSHIEAQP